MAIIEKLAKPKNRISIPKNELVLYKIKEIGIIKGGISTLDKNEWDSGINFVNYMDVFKNFYIDNDTKLRKYNASNNDLKRFSLNFGDVIFTASSETQNEIAMSTVYLSTKTAIFNGFCKVLKYDQNLLLPKFACYYFRSNIFRKEVIKCATGYTRYNISKKDLDNITVKIPPIEVQKNIIDIIELLDLIIYEIELKEVSWKRKIIYLINWIFEKSEKEIKLSDLLFLNPPLNADPNSMFISASTVDNLSYEPYNFQNAKLSSENSIIFIKDGASVGKSNFSSKGVNIASTMISFKANNVTTTKFIHFWLKKNKKTIDSLKKGSVIPHIYFKDLIKLNIFLPSLEIQKKAIDVLEPLYEMLNLIKKQKKLYKLKHKHYLNYLIK